MRNIIAKLTLIGVMLGVINPGITLAAVTEGEHTWSIEQRDKAGNPNSELTQTINLDLTHPEVNITANPDINAWTNTNKKFTASISDINLLSSKYALINSGAECNSSAVSIDATNIDLTFDNESYNGKQVCIVATDKATNKTIVTSNTINKIDKTDPTIPNYTSSFQNGWNKISIKGTCTYEPGLQFVVLDNGVEIDRIDLSDPCEINYSKVLTEPPHNHNITYYLEDPATNKSPVQGFSAVVDSTGVLVTPASGKEVGKVVSFTGFTLPNKEVKIERGDGQFIASATSDNNGNFVMQTTESQPLGDMTVDLVIDGVPKGEPRTITVVADAVIIPEIDETSVYSKYSGEKDIYSFESQIISFKVKGEPLSLFKVYSTLKNSGDDEIVEIAQGQFDASGNASVSSNVKLPGGENIIYIVDKVHKVSSHIFYVVVADPFGVVYDSETKNPIAGAKITMYEEGQTAPAVLPLLHGEAQPNPIITDTNGNYTSYEETGKKYYYKVEASGYTFPSTIIPSGSKNLDGTDNVGSHGQVFTITSTPLHIDVPMDPIKETSKSSGGGGGGFNTAKFSTVIAYKDSINKASNGNILLAAEVNAGTSTKEKVYRAGGNGIGGGVYLGGVVKFMMHETDKSRKKIIGVPLSEEVKINITNTKYNSSDKILIRYSEDEEWKELKDYEVNGNTIIFNTKKGFELKFEKTEIVLEKSLEKKVIISKHEAEPYYIDKIEYALFKEKILEEYGKSIEKLDYNFVIDKYPKALTIIKAKENKDIMKGKFLSKKRKMLYNLVLDIYNERYNQYLSSIGYSSILKK